MSGLGTCLGKAALLVVLLLLLLSSPHKLAGAQANSESPLLDAERLAQVRRTTATTLSQRQGNSTA
jgi:hypothetical protein